MENKIYKCECGKEFNNPQSFNGHKSHCEIHLKLHNKLYVKENIKKALLQGSIKGPQTKAIKKHNDLLIWISEKHICEKCGKVMTEKFGSGRFCSRSCANTRQPSKETKEKISSSVNRTYLDIIQNNKIAYYNNPNYCVFCNQILPYEMRHYKLCSNDCYSKYFNLVSKKIGLGGLTKSSGGRSKRGWYKGFWCDSTWELAWIIYNLDHNIPFSRCPRNIYYLYEYKGKTHRYYPDFILPDNSLVEIKGYHSEIVDLKTNSVNDRIIKVLYEKDLKYAFDYVKQTYNVVKIEELYE